MPSGSIQAIPQYLIVDTQTFDSKFQCHLVRFKLFRSGRCLPGALFKWRRFNAIWFDSSYSATLKMCPTPALFVGVSMPSGSIQAIPPHPL